MQTPTRFSVSVCCVLMLTAIRWIATTSAQTQSTTAPATQSPTTQPDEELAADSPIRKWFIQLADDDPRVRDQAREDLMGITGDQLPKLRQLIIESQPVTPDQTAALHDIVIQAYLATVKYDIADGKQSDPNGTEGSSFFLGMLWSSVPSSEVRLGVPVEERIPGFPSYRFLRTGDMILGIYINTNASLAQFPNTETHDIASLTASITTSPRVQNVALQVLRDGQLLKIPIKMAPRPLCATPQTIGALRQLVADRAVDADRYWNENFAPLLGQIANSD